MKEKIKKAYYEAYRKYFFNLLLGRDDLKIYFMGMTDVLASLYQGETDIFEEVRDKAKADAKKDHEYYKNFC